MSEEKYYKYYITGGHQNGGDLLQIGSQIFGRSGQLFQVSFGPQ